MNAPAYACSSYPIAPIQLFAPHYTPSNFDCGIRDKSIWKLCRAFKKTRASIHSPHTIMMPFLSTSLIPALRSFVAQGSDSLMKLNGVERNEGAFGRWKGRSIPVHEKTDYQALHGPLPRLRTKNGDALSRRFVLLRLFQQAASTSCAPT